MSMTHCTISTPFYATFDPSNITVTDLTTTRHDTTRDGRSGKRMSPSNMIRRTPRKIVLPALRLNCPLLSGPAAHLIFCDSTGWWSMLSHCYFDSSHLIRFKFTIKLSFRVLITAQVSDSQHAGADLQFSCCGPGKSKSRQEIWHRILRVGSLGRGSLRAESSPVPCWKLCRTSGKSAGVPLIFFWLLDAPLFCSLKKYRT